MTKKKRVNALFIKNVKEKGKYPDSRGLVLVVEASGSKRWVQRLTIHGKRRDLGLGSAQTVSLSDARTIAYENLKIARSGGDPTSEKKKTKQIPKFEEAALIVYNMRKETWRNPKHAAQFLSTLRTYAYPKIGKKPVSEITSKDIHNVLEPIWVNKHETASRVLQRISVIMQWATTQQYCLFDPSQHVTRGLSKVSKAPKHRKSLPYNQVIDCIGSILASKAMPSTKLALEFLILTATRSGEVRGARWSEINLDEAVWTIPAERMKANKEHRVPLSPRALQVLVDAKIYSSGDLVFEGAKAGRPMSDMTMSKLVKELGFDVDVHGFRTSFRVWVQEKTDTGFDVAEAALAHTLRDKSAAAYARSDLFDKRRELMNAWADYLKGASKNTHTRALIG